MIPSSIAGGLAGAAALTLIHETVRKVDPDAPRMDLLGMNALSKALRSLGRTPPPRHQLFNWTMAGDLISNALYYSLAGRGSQKEVLTKGFLLGFSAGLGAVFLPGPMGLIEGPSNRTTKTQAMTVALYTIGGLVAAGASFLFRRKRS